MPYVGLPILFRTSGHVSPPVLLSPCWREVDGFGLATRGAYDTHQALGFQVAQTGAQVPLMMGHGTRQVLVAGTQGTLEPLLVGLQRGEGYRRLGSA